MRIHLAGKGERAGCLHAARKLFFLNVNLKWKCLKTVEIEEWL